MSQDNQTSSAWHEIIHAKLQATATPDDSIIDFIEEEVPEEGDTLDYKEDLYVSADPSHHDKNRRGKLIKLFSALANVRTQARFRYLLVLLQTSFCEFVTSERADSTKI